MKLRIFSILIAFSLLLAACAPKNATPTGVVDESPYQVQGTFEVTNDFVLAIYYVEHAVGLVDMHAFVIRDEEWEIPVDSQVLGYMDVNDDFLGGTFDLNLPLRPEGTFNDVDNDGESDTGVQIFAVSYWPNLYGGPFSVGDDRSAGWPSYLASVRTDTENNDEVIGGDLLVWAPDAGQSFPTGFGADGLLFTADDPVGPLPAGWTQVNLDSEPFTQIRQPTLSMQLYEPQDVALKDFSGMSYTEAFEAMFAVVRVEYAFNGIDGKQPDWDALYAEILPRVQQAERDNDRQAYYLALRDFTLAFNDGHVGLGGGSQYLGEMFQRDVEGGYGFAIRELDDGRFLVNFLLAGGPAEQSGMVLGAELLEVDGRPTAEALLDVRPYSMPHSSTFSLRYQQARYLLRAPLNTERVFTFANPGGAAQTITLRAVSELDSFNQSSIYRFRPANYDLLQPVEYELLDDNIGYIRINSNSDDLGLIVRLFERALKTFQDAEVAGIIIDMRFNNGGAPLGLAGFLTDQEIEMGQLEYYSEATGAFEPEGLREKVLPNESQYRFDKMVLLVDQGCYSACEIEAYGFSQVPGMIVVGQFPTGGVEAEVARGQFQLPDGFFLQIPTGRFTLPDGSIFLEGQGVQPTLRVPVDESTIYSQEDIVLQAGMRAVLQPLGAGITPSGPPEIVPATQAESKLLAGTDWLEDRAREQYTAAQLAVMDQTFTYTVPLGASRDLIWGWGWCAVGQETLADNFSAIQLTFSLNGTVVPADQLAAYEYVPQSAPEQVCRIYYLALTKWPGGEHDLSTRVEFTRALNDGTADYAAGVQTFEYKVIVKP